VAAPAEALAIGRLVRGLAEARGETLSPERVAIYVDRLSRFPLAAVERACEQALDRLRFFPTVAELVERIEGSEEELAALAWSRVHRAALGGWGGYTPITFGDPVIHAAVTAMGGWHALYHLGYRGIESVEIATARKAFIEFWLAYRHRGAPMDTPATLCVEHGTAHLAPRVVPLELPDAAPREIEVPPSDTMKALPDGEFRPDVKPLIDEVAQRLAVVGVRARPEPAPPMPEVSDTERAAHERRRRGVADEFRRAVGGADGSEWQAT
jgi:hypothetical protein